MKVSVDRDMCIGSRNCENTCPEVFAVRDGKSNVKVDTVPEYLEARVLEAEKGCLV
ncbi:MAG: ferredoxin [Desulfobulbaceae bacterium]|nr:ferredoxin [Desulfobulbaceae bacterium]